MRWNGTGLWVAAAVSGVTCGGVLLIRPSPLQTGATEAPPANAAVTPEPRPTEPEPTTRGPASPRPAGLEAATPSTSSVGIAAVPSSEVPASPFLAVEAEISSSNAPVPGRTVPSVSLAAAPPNTPRAVGTPRRVSLTPLAAWSNPGLCSTHAAAEATREKLTTNFRRFEGEGLGPLHLDPRLPPDAASGIVPLLERAQNEVAQRLGLKPSPPSTFVYFDQQLMKAAACINEDVVAFYDGALHVVADRSDLQQSVTHELTHHALFTSGVVGPAWAQEGIAMLVAQETWWRAPARLRALLGEPFSAEQMDSLIPYKLSSDQAVGFYVQAAWTVQCLLARRRWSLAKLAETLRASSEPNAVSYDLPELDEATFLSSCATSQGGAP